MPFTVARRGGTKDIDFSPYVRQLRFEGVDLGRALRTLEPGAGRRWLYVWDNREKAETFARKLKKDTGYKAWQILPVEGPVSEGPLGPIEVEIGLRSDGCGFGLHPLSWVMLQALFPDAERLDIVSVRARTNHVWRAADKLQKLVRQVLPILTGITLEQLEKLGYRLSDPENNKELFLVPPGDTCPTANGLPVGLPGTEQSALQRR
jgi:hypothetical protein